MPDLPNLARFCQQHPTLMVRYQFGNFVLNDFNIFTFVGFVTTGVALTFAVAGDDAGLEAQRALLYSRIPMRTLIQEAQHWCEIWGVQYHLRSIKNFSFWPMTTGNGKVDDLPGYVVFARTAIAKRANSKRKADWLRYTKVWFETGILGAE
jgi:hypothetical protein